MFHSICKELQRIRPIASTTKNVYLFSTSAMKTFFNSQNSPDPQSLSLSYLINSCGLSLESATSASTKLQFETTDNPDEVLNLLKTHGLTQTHIKNLITNRPHLLLADASKTLKPNIEVFGTLGFSGTKLVKLINKEHRILETNAHRVVEFFRAYGFSDEQISTLTMKLPRLYFRNFSKSFRPKMEYFKSLGLSGLEIAQMLSSEPSILQRSLENHIIPSVQLIRRIVGDDESVLKTIKGCYIILESNLEEVLEPNVTMLMNHGVPKSNVLKLIRIFPKSLLVRNNRFSEVVRDIKKLGFDPMKLTFIYAIRSMAFMSKSLWEWKLELYYSFGLSEEEMISAFKLQPRFMSTSEKVIKKLMSFYVNELKLKPSMISKNPNLMLRGLEKTIIPRCSVLQLLISKGLIRRSISLVFALKMTEKMFVGRFVNKYEHEIPEVVEAHQGKMHFREFTLNLIT